MRIKTFQCLLVYRYRAVSDSGASRISGGLSTCLDRESDLAMAHNETLRDELDTLQAELTRPAADPPPKAGHPNGHEPDRKGVPAFDLERLLGELQSTLLSASEDAEETLSSHPLAAVGIAFLLGVLVGRISGRGR